MYTHLYHVVPTSTTRRRSFTVTCGLQVGYGAEAETFSRHHAVQAVEQWMRRRAARDQPFLTAFVPGDIVYAWGDAGRAETRVEPAVKFEGEVSVIYHAELDDEAVKELLNELGEVLGKALGQVRVYLTYLDEAWVLEATGQTSPRRR